VCSPESSACRTGITSRLDRTVSEVPLWRGSRYEGERMTTNKLTTIRPPVAAPYPDHGKHQ
jgi:hypothetical protein